MRIYTIRKGQKKENLRSNSIVLHVTRPLQQFKLVIKSVDKLFYDLAFVASIHNIFSIKK